MRKDNELLRDAYKPDTDVFDYTITAILFVAIITTLWELFA